MAGGGGQAAGHAAQLRRSGNVGGAENLKSQLDSAKALLEEQVGVWCVSDVHSLVVCGQS